MKKLLLVLLLASLAFAEFQLQGIDVALKLNEDGSAVVEERINIIVTSQYSQQIYETGFNNNTLSGWQQTTNITEIKMHAGRNSDIRNVIIRPQPLQRSLSVSDIWYGQIIIDYSVYPYYEKDGNLMNGTGLVSLEKYKPRVTRYSLNVNAFTFPRTGTGDIRLDEGTTLSLTPPSNSVITYVNPITKETRDVTLPTKARALSWSSLTLTQFSLTYEIEQSLDKEVVAFFSDLQEKIKTSLVSTEGLAASGILLLLVLAYFYLRFSRR